MACKWNLLTTYPNWDPILQVQYFIHQSKQGQVKGKISSKITIDLLKKFDLPQDGVILMTPDLCKLKKS